MEYVTLRADFANHDEYRLLAVEADWVQQIREKIAVHSHQPCAPVATVGDGQLPQGRGVVEREDTVVMTMKGRDQLLACDDGGTFRVRRVEYSNTLLLAEEHSMSEHDFSALLHTSSTSDAAATGAKERQKHVVVCAAGRLFEVKRARAYRDAIHLLRKFPITISELEADEEDIGNGRDNNAQETQEAEEEEPQQRLEAAAIRMDPHTAGGSQLYTFPQLVAQSRCSARELADTLAEEGAVVHHGKVRLLCPSLLREALQAALFFLEGSDDATWEAVELHLCPSVYPPVIVHAVRAAYGKTDGTEGERAAAALLHVGKVLRALAAAVFTESGTVEKVGLSGSGSYPLLDFEQFYDAWVDKIPASFFACGVPPRSEPEALLSFLHGYTVIRRVRSDSYTGATVVWAPHDTLDDELPRRVGQLFELGPGRWEGNALRAYLQPLLDPGVAFDHAVQRHVNEFRVPNQPVMYGKLV